MSIEFETDPETGRPIVDLDRTTLGPLHLHGPFELSLDQIGPTLRVRANAEMRPAQARIELVVSGTSALKLLTALRELLEKGVDFEALEAATRQIRQ